jgi:hypothetical protein
LSTKGAGEGFSQAAGTILQIKDIALWPPGGEKSADKEA